MNKLKNWDSTEKRYWKSICEIYFLTKHYILKAEEISLKLETFLQPVKEHRDAFDHIARVYGYELMDKNVENPDSYRTENLKKALGHVYRAFFDTADWLSYECRKQIRETLAQIPPDEINSKYPEYNEAKECLNSIPFEIANIRANKDIGNTPGELVSVVQQYKEKLDLIVSIYTKILEIFPVVRFEDSCTD